MMHAYAPLNMVRWPDWYPRKHSFLHKPRAQLGTCLVCSSGAAGVRPAPHKTSLFSLGGGGAGGDPPGMCRACSSAAAAGHHCTSLVCSSSAMARAARKGGHRMCPIVGAVPAATAMVPAQYTCLVLPCAPAVPPRDGSAATAGQHQAAGAWLSLLPIRHGSAHLHGGFAATTVGAHRARLCPAVAGGASGSASQGPDTCSLY